MTENRAKNYDMMTASVFGENKEATSKSGKIFCH